MEELGFQNPKRPRPSVLWSFNCQATLLAIAQRQPHLTYVISLIALRNSYAYKAL